MGIGRKIRLNFDINWGTIVLDLLSFHLHTSALSLYGEKALSPGSEMVSEYNDCDISPSFCAVLRKLAL